MSPILRPTLPNIALAGRSGTGKSTVAKYLVEGYGYHHLKSGALCREIALRLFGGESKTTLNEISDAMRTINSDVWISATLRHVPRGVGPVVFDSMRWIGDHEILASRGYVLWQFSASFNERITRLRVRGQDYDPTTVEFHLAETELETADFDWRLDTTPLSDQELREAVDVALQHLSDD